MKIWLARFAAPHAPDSQSSKNLEEQSTSSSCCKRCCVEHGCKTAEYEAFNMNLATMTPDKVKQTKFHLLRDAMSNFKPEVCMLV
jgi:hypothetical protein